MSELADFKEYLFELRGELTYMIHSERLSRDGELAFLFVGISLI